MLNSIYYYLGISRIYFYQANGVMVLSEITGKVEEYCPFPFSELLLNFSQHSYRLVSNMSLY